MTPGSPSWIGRIRRKELWPVLGVEEFPELQLIDEPTRNHFRDLVRIGLIRTEVTETREIAIRELTAGGYLRHARTCYEGAFKAHPWLSDGEFYRAFADGRSAGLLDVPPENPDAFFSWYEAHAFSGAHPFEIVRDHTVLFVHRLPVAPRDFFLRLANRSRHAVEPDLILMALALHRTEVPFYMENGEAHAQFAAGEDWIAVIDDRVLKDGSPKIPRAVGTLSAPQNVVLLSQLECAPHQRAKVEWLEENLEYEYLHR